MLFFVVGFLVGFVEPLAGVGGGVLFTPLAVGLPAAMMGSSVAGSLQAGVA
jgi:uncharacterized membrane protein YfcA